MGTNRPSNRTTHIATSMNISYNCMVSNFLKPYSRHILYFLAGVVFLQLDASTYAQASTRESRTQTPPFELGGIFLFGDQSNASIHPRNGEGKAIWLEPGQSWGNLSLIEINSQESQVKIRYAGEEHILGLKKASDLPIPLHLKPNVIEQDGRLMRKMRIPAGRGRSRSSGTVLMRIPEDQIHTATNVAGSTAAGSLGANSNSSRNSEAQDQGSSSSGSETLTTAELRDFQIPERRASIRAKALKSREAP